MELERPRRKHKVYSDVEKEPSWSGALTVTKPKEKKYENVPIQRKEKSDKDFKFDNLTTNYFSGNKGLYQGNVENLQQQSSENEEIYGSTENHEADVLNVR